MYQYRFAFLTQSFIIRLIQLLVILCPHFVQKMLSRICFQEHSLFCAKKILNSPQLYMYMFSLKAFSHELFMNSFLESLPSWHTIQRKYVSFRSTIEFVFTFQAPIVESFYSVKLWIVNYYVKCQSDNLSNENTNTGVSREIILQKQFILAF